MITHFFTLCALSKEFHALLAGATIVEVFTQHRNELAITLALNEHEHDRRVTLHVSVEPRNNYMVIRDELSRARKNSVDLFSVVVGQTVLGVRMHPYDRTMIVDVGNASPLFFQLYDT